MTDTPRLPLRSLHHAVRTVTMKAQTKGGTVRSCVCTCNRRVSLRRAAAPGSTHRAVVKRGDDLGREDTEAVKSATRAKLSHSRQADVRTLESGEHLAPAEVVRASDRIVRGPVERKAVGDVRFLFGREVSRVARRGGEKVKAHDAEEDGLWRAVEKVSSESRESER